jgi:hypothetical protein
LITFGNITLSVLLLVKTPPPLKLPPLAVKISRTSALLVAAYEFALLASARANSRSMHARVYFLAIYATLSKIYCGLTLRLNASRSPFMPVSMRA